MHCICLWKGPLPTLAFPATSELRLPCSKLTSPLQNGCIWIPRHGELPEYKLASSPHIIMRGPNECKNHRPPENFIYLTLNSYFIVRTDTLQRKSLKIKIPQKGPSENTHSAGEKSPAWSILHTFLFHQKGVIHHNILQMLAILLLFPTGETVILRNGSRSVKIKWWQILSLSGHWFDQNWGFPW